MAEKPCSNFHGVAAKIINVYLKCTIVIHRNENMSCEQLKLLDQIHPPVDATLLGSLQHYYSTEEREKTVGQPNILEGVLTNLGLQNRHGLSDGFQKFKKAAWSNYNSETYEACIALFRVAQGTEALWEIERHWVGNQQAGTPTTDSDVPT